jgi:hypothetical protein
MKLVKLKLLESREASYCVAITKKSSLRQDEANQARSGKETKIKPSCQHTRKEAAEPPTTFTGRVSPVLETVREEEASLQPTASNDLGRML